MSYEPLIIFKRLYETSRYLYKSNLVEIENVENVDNNNKLFWRKSVKKSWNNGKSKEIIVWWPIMSETKNYSYQVPTILQIIKKIQVQKKIYAHFFSDVFKMLILFSFFSSYFRFLLLKICFQIPISRFFDISDFFKFHFFGNKKQP